MTAGPAAAVRLALDLMHVPSRVKFVRNEPLPEGIDLLLRVAASDAEAIAEAAQLAGRAENDIKEAAAFFIEQLMFSTAADSYRVLGASRTASSGELRRNMALLLRWLHPDTNNAHNALYAGRVTRAWEDLKTPQRRQAYDDQQRSHEQHEAAQRSRGRSRRRPTSQMPATPHGCNDREVDIREGDGSERDMTASLREAMRNLFAHRKD